ncbi:MAG: hypothetical protein WCO84_05745 [bacterium]
MKHLLISLFFVLSVVLIGCGGGGGGSSVVGPVVDNVIPGVASITNFVINPIPTTSPVVPTPTPTPMPLKVTYATIRTTGLATTNGINTSAKSCFKDKLDYNFRAAGAEDMNFWPTTASHAIGVYIFLEAREPDGRFGAVMIGGKGEHYFTSIEEPVVWPIGSAFLFVYDD